MAGFQNDVMVSKNINFNEAAPKPHLGIINAAGKLPIGTGQLDPIPEILGGNIISPTNSITIAYSSPNITAEVSPIAVPPSSTNLGIAYAAGTFTVQAHDGTALSPSNPAHVWVQSRTVPGRLVRYTVTANQTFTDGAAGGTDNQRFGLISGNVWGANDIPFFLYAVENDAETAVAFMISRDPSAQVAPAAAQIGQSGAVVNVDQRDFFSLAAITVGDYEGNACTYIGCFRMRFTGATDSWTVQAIAQGIDGVGINFDTRIFNMPIGVQGAASSSFFFSNGGTAPVWSSQQLTYVIQRNGILKIHFAADTVTTPSAGAVDAILALPYSFSTINMPYRGVGWLVLPTTIVVALFPKSPAVVPASRAIFFTNGNAGTFSLAGIGAAGTTIAINCELNVYFTT